MNKMNGANQMRLDHHGDDGIPFTSNGTFAASNWGDSAPRALSYDVYTPGFDDGASAVPFSMGRMTNYFSKPGYQLGDSLSNGYRYFEQPVYQYQDEFGEEALR